jgi:hypothetical protein
LLSFGRSSGCTPSPNRSICAGLCNTFLPYFVAEGFFIAPHSPPTACSAIPGKTKPSTTRMQGLDINYERWHVFTYAGPTSYRRRSAFPCTELLFVVEPAGIRVDDWDAMSRHQIQEGTIRHLQEFRTSAYRELVGAHLFQYT